MGDGKIHVYFIFLRPFLFEISQRRKEEPKHVFRETVPEKGRMDGYTQGISQSTWGGLGPGLSSELLTCLTHWITLVQWVKFALWWSYSTSSCGQTNNCSLEAATSEPRPRGGPQGPAWAGGPQSFSEPCGQFLHCRGYDSQQCGAMASSRMWKKNTMSHLLRQTCTCVWT